MLKMEKRLLNHTNPDLRLRRVGTTAKSKLKNPFYQIILFGVILIIVQMLSSAGVVSSSFAMALCRTLIYGIMAIGFCLLLGFSGLASLGTAGFVGIGAYVTYFCLQEWGIPYIGAILITILLAILIGTAVGFVSLRIEGIYLAIITLGLAEVMRYVFLNIKDAIRIQIRNITLFGTQVGRATVFYLIVAMMVLLMIILVNLMNSPTGRAMLAMKNSTSAAQAMGVSLLRYRLLAFIITTIYAALAGSLYMLYFRSVTTSVETLFMLATSLNILGAVVLGGSRSIWGTLFGTFLIYGLQGMFLQNIPFFANNPVLIYMLTGLLIILVVMFFPGGFAQMFVSLKYRIIGWRAKWRLRKYGTEE